MTSFKETPRSSNLLRVHSLCSDAVAASADELAASRIDTTALALTLVASLSRIGCLVAQVAVCFLGEAYCRQEWGDAYVTTVLGVGCRRLGGANLAKAKRRREENEDGDDRESGDTSTRETRLGGWHRQQCQSWVGGEASLGEVLTACCVTHGPH